MGNRNLARQNPTGFEGQSFSDAIVQFVNDLFEIVAPPLASPKNAVNLIGGMGVESKQNTVNSPTQASGSNRRNFASMPTRYMSANEMFSIPNIEFETPDTMVPAELGPSRNLYEFFNSNMNIAYQLPSVNAVKRYNSQNDSKQR